MSKIVWLASYPKSGNTWTRVFLTNYLRDCAEPADVNALDNGPMASHRVGFDELVGIEASQLPPRIVSRLRPEAYRMLAQESTDRLYIKVHDAWSLTDLGASMFPADETLAVIYILRNPLDVAVSYAHHTGGTMDQTVANMCDSGYVIGLREQRPADQLPQHLGTWSEHVASWVDDSGLPLLVLRYEDLHADPVGTFGKVVDFLGLPADSDRLRRAVDFSRLEELQRQEAATGFYERPATSSAPFFRQGKVGSWRQDLRGDLAEQLQSAHRTTMDRFGYGLGGPYEC